MINLSLIPTPAYWAAIGVLTLAVAAQQVRVSGLQSDVAEAGTALTTEKTERATEKSQRLQVALDHAATILKLQTDHAVSQQKKEDENAQKIRTLEADKLAATARAGRLRDDLAAYTAAGARPGEACAATLKRTADRISVVGGLLGEGIGLVTEGRAIVERRNVEVAGLLDQIKIDRAACSPPAGASGVPKP